MACGKAVIGSNAGGIVDVIIKGKNGLLVKQGDAEELSGAMISLFTNEEERLAIGLAAREFAKLHDWSNVAEKVEGIYGSGSSLTLENYLVSS